MIRNNITDNDKQKRLMFIPPKKTSVNDEKIREVEPKHKLVPTTKIVSKSFSDAKRKRARRLFGRVEGREPGLSKEAIEALAMKKLTFIAGKKIEAVMDHLGLRDSSTTNDAQEKDGDDDYPAFPGLSGRPLLALPARRLIG